MVQLDGTWVYSLCVLEGDSRKMLAGMVSEHQDLTAMLQLLFVALSEYGCPKAIVSDNGSVFTAGAYLGILRPWRSSRFTLKKASPGRI